MRRVSTLVMFLAFGLYCMIYPGSLFVLVTNQVPEGTEWMASLMLFAMGIAATSWVMVNYGSGRGLRACLAVLGLGFVLETVGVLTGFPFGAYVYTDALAPKILVVPIAITFAWLMIVLSSFFMARIITQRIFPGHGQPTVLVLTVGLAVGSDLLMEPVAFHVQGYWLWQGTGFYYGVPFSNFVAWTVATLVLVAVFTRLGGVQKREKTGGGDFFFCGFVPPTLYMLNLLMFTAINLTQSYYLAAVIGALALSSCGCVLLSLIPEVFSPWRLILNRRHAEDAKVN